MDINTVNILITGGLGFIGRALAQHLLAEGGHRLTIVDKLSEQVHGPDPDYSDITTHPQVSFFRADICTPGVLCEALAGAEVVYHLAAETGTGQSMYEIQSYFQSNVMGTAALLEHIVRDPARRPRSVVLASSRSVYGEGAYVRETKAQDPGATRHFPRTRRVADMEAGRFDFQLDGTPLTPVPTRETDPTDPQSLYAASKLTQEQMCRIACASVGVNFTALRFQNVYGPGQSLRNPYTGILSIFTNILRQGGTIDIFEDGEESRDFVYVQDAVRALRVAPDRAPGTPEVINVGQGARISVARLVAMLERKIGVEGRSKVSGRFRPGDIRHNYADTTLMATVLGLSSLVDLETGLSATVDWALTQPAEDDRSEKANRELSAFLKTKTRGWT